MLDSIPLVVSLFYITAGYMLVAGVTASVVTVAAHKLQSKIAYGALATLSFAGVGYQVSSALYYQEVETAVAAMTLIWQMDFATLGLIAAFIFLAFERIVRLHPLRILVSMMALSLAMVVTNRLTDYSLHFDQVAGSRIYTQGQLAGLRYLQGVPGFGARIWYGTMAAVLVWGIGVALKLWQHGFRRRCVFVVLYICVLASSLLVNIGIDWGALEAVYLLGFAFTAFVIIMSVSLVMEAVRRSQQLALRDREMHEEIIERRRVEGKLQRLSQVFMQEPAPIHIVAKTGETLQVNDASQRFLRADVSQSPKVNFLEVLTELGVNRDQVLAQLADGTTCEFGPYFFAGGVPVDSLFFVTDSWINFKLYPIFDRERGLEEFVVRLEDVTEKQFVDTAINTISNAVSTETGQAFFTGLVLHLAQLLKKKYVFIGLTTDYQNKPHLQTLAAACDGELIENFFIPVEQSPLGVIFQNQVYCVAQRAQQDFPWQTFLKQMKVESYVGVAIGDEQGEPIGALMVMDAHPMDNVEKLSDLVRIFVSRVGSELQRIESERTIRTMAFEDMLTGLPNRAALSEYVEKLLKKESGQHAFMQLDLDHFKTINDALGHDVGDEVIKVLGRRLSKAAKDKLYVSRIGGDEFVVILPNLGEHSGRRATLLAKQVLQLLEKPVRVGDHLLDVGCTIGIVRFPADAESVVDTFRYADIALHKAKLGGRGGFEMFTPAMREEVSHRVVIEKGLRHALSHAEFTLHYQPQLDAEGELIGAEVLLRWLHPKQGYISPSDFIPVAEESGLINPIGEWVLKDAMRTRKRWFDERIPFSGHLSINVSAWQFARPDFVESTLAQLDIAKIPPSFVTLEITETAVLSDVKDTIRKMSELRQQGITIALDDFGTGYSSLAYLRDLPLDALKIDKAFVDVLDVRAQEPLVETMISIGRHMGLKVVAEGVQTQLQLERLKALGCNAFQGFLLAKPMNEQDFSEWLLHRKDGSVLSSRA